MEFGKEAKPKYTDGADVVAFLFPGILHDVRNIFSRLKTTADYGCIANNPSNVSECIQGIRDEVDSEGLPFLEFLTALYVAHPVPEASFVFPDSCLIFIKMLRSTLREWGISFSVAAGKPIEIPADYHEFARFVTRLIRDLLIAEPIDYITLSCKGMENRFSFLLKLQAGPQATLRSSILSQGLSYGSVYAQEHPDFSLPKGNSCNFNQAVSFSWYREEKLR
ncbi:MAG TPA: hypothetical protein PLG43_11705 [Spirochaetia bacterium]|nr:hypothetical protein [Spirochaetia bacterium]